MPSSSSDNSSPDLKYPPVQVNHPLSTLDIDTLIMRSTSRRHPEEAGSALDESTFEFLGDSLLEISDDEAHTESIASTATDDASDFSDDDVDYPSEDHELQHSMHPSHAGDAEQHHDSRSIHSAGDSTLTEVPAYGGYHGDSHNLRLDERLGEDSAVVQGSKIYRSFPEGNGYFFDVLKQYGHSQVRLVVKAALSQQSIPTPDSYRILYVGPISAGEEEVVSSKICAALTAGQSTSRSVMVQGRLQPYSPVMHTYHCADIKTWSKGDEPTCITMMLQNGKKLAFGSARQSSSEAQPDLVIFCHPSIPRKIMDATEYAAAREVLIREKIPHIDMISAKQYGYGVDSYDPRGLNICIEGRDDSAAEYQLQEVLPMDYYTFSCLEPAQINRHLALISPHMLASTDKRPRASKIGDFWTSCTKNLQAPQPTPMRMLMLLMLLTGMISSYFFAPLMGTTLSDALSDYTVPSPEITLNVMPDSFALSSSTTSHVLTTPTTSISKLSPPAITSASSDLSVVPQPPKAKKAEKKKSEKIVPFTIETTTDQQFMLVPHKDILSARKKPQLQIKVTRDSHAISVRFNRTISGAYIVDLEQQQPFGTFNVSIASYSKPLLQQSFEITLGQNKSTLAQYLDTAAMKMVDIQHRLNISTAGVHDMLPVVCANAAFQFYIQRVQGAGQAIAADVQTVKDIVGRILQVKVTDVQEAAWHSVQEATAPVRRSSPLLRARMNALRVRCKVETATGLSQDGKESWACSKVRGGQ
jgi:hypothetical protein